MALREMAQLCKHTGLRVNASIHAKVAKCVSVTLVLARWGRGMGRTQV